MWRNVSDMPLKLRCAFGDYTACVFDAGCGEPLGWGFKILRRVTDAHWSDSKAYGELVLVGDAPGSWVLVTKWLTPAEAIEKYGDVTSVERGPRGGFRSVIYGKKLFLSKRVDPKI